MRLVMVLRQGALPSIVLLLLTPRTPELDHPSLVFAASYRRETGSEKQPGVVETT